MAEVPTAVRVHGGAALEALDQIHRDGPDYAKQQIDEVMKRLVLMRNDLINAEREGRYCGPWLRGSNAIRSSIMGTEYPKGGLQWDRVSETRDALKRMMDGNPLGVAGHAFQ